MQELCIEQRGGVLKVGQLLAYRLELLLTEWLTSLAELPDGGSLVAIPRCDYEH